MKEIFKIYQLDAAEADRIADSENNLHHHDFEELIIGTEGQLEHFIDFKSEIFVAPFISFVSKGKIHRVKPQPRAGKCQFWVLRFKSEFIPETTFQLYNHFHDHATFSIGSSPCFQRLVTVSQMIADEMQTKNADLGIVRQLLSTLFTMIESEYRKQFPEGLLAPSNTSTTFKNFLTILEENYHRPESVNFYAEKLFMSARALNLICHQILQQSVSEIIETRKLIEAKSLLMNTDKTISEIGFELGYTDKAYFTTVFKRKSGQTPTDFRNDMRKIISK
ncbi:AraC family transcriptional regulator [Sphingobacterium faecium]|uniref:AraC family transcriptional regulator n=1 Tax=Sphingobacterium faecium TaxID=34087 RepID=UPI002469599C|nr:AraC family transcriptional regulator [Sphingobacterium faecium]MDH5826139.1 AraC family transcriptional regulator [Sphingobacterium faecium]